MSRKVSFSNAANRQGQWQMACILAELERSVDTGTEKGGSRGGCGLWGAAGPQAVAVRAIGPHARKLIEQGGRS